MPQVDDREQNECRAEDGSNHSMRARPEDGEARDGKRDAADADKRKPTAFGQQRAQRRPRADIVDFTGDKRWRVHHRPFSASKIEKSAGPSRTRNIAGKIMKMSGKRIFRGAFCAFSSA